MKFRGNTKQCEMDVNNYSSLVNRWKTNKSLKLWWSGLTPAAKTAWFRKEQTHCAGRKRSFDEVAFEESASRLEVNSRMGQHLQIPIRVYIRNSFLEGIPRNIAIQKFSEIVSNQRELCTYENNEWHVPDYGGILSQNGTLLENGWTSAKKVCDVRSTDQLHELMASANKSVDDAATASSSSMLVAMPPKLQDYPDIMRNTADTSKPPKSQQTISASILQEVECANLNWVYRLYLSV